MSAREEKARQYIESGRFIARQFFKYDIKNAYLDGWDEALKSLWVRVEDGLPEPCVRVLVIIEYFGYIQIHPHMYFGENEWYFGPSKVIAWMPIPSFDEILKANKDVLRRLKDK